MDKLSYEEIYFEYWDFEASNNEDPIYDLFNQDDRDSLLIQMSKYLRMYFRNQSALAHLSFKELLATGSMLFQPNKAWML